MRPLEIRLTADRSSLDIHWSDGVTTRLSAQRLSAHCRSAPATRRRIDGAEPSSSAGLSILDVKPIGQYAINLIFSDGNDRGIYPWAHLRDLAGTGGESVEPSLGD